MRPITLRLIMRTAFIYRDGKQPRLAKRFMIFCVAFRATYLSENNLAYARLVPKAVGPFNSRDAFKQVCHTVFFRPIPLVLKLLIHDDDATKTAYLQRMGTMPWPFVRSYFLHLKCFVDGAHERLVKGFVR